MTDAHLCYRYDRAHTPGIDHRLTVLAFNVLAQSLVRIGDKPYIRNMGLSKWEERWPRLQQIIRRMKGGRSIDIVILSECDVEYLGIWTNLMHELSMDRVAFATRTDTATHGVAMFVNRHHVFVEHVETARTGAATILASLRHLSGFRFVCIGTHLKAKAEHEEQRVREVTELTRLVYERFGTKRPIIIAGDMNTHDIATSPSFTVLCELARRDRDKAATAFPFTTIKETEPGVVTSGIEDHVLFSDDDFVPFCTLVPHTPVGAEHSEDSSFFQLPLTIPMPGADGISDHIPILVSLAIKEKNEIE